MKKLTKTKKKIYIKCVHCGDEIFGYTNKELTPCKCGKISVDGCEDYIRINGDKEDYIATLRCDL